MVVVVVVVPVEECGNKEQTNTQHGRTHLHERKKDRNRENSVLCHVMLQVVVVV